MVIFNFKIIFFLPSFLLIDYKPFINYVLKHIDILITPRETPTRSYFPLKKVEKNSKCFENFLLKVHFMNKLSRVEQ